MIHMASRVNSRDLMPMVELRWDGPDLSGELTPAEARTHALHILETAEAAEHDAAFVRFAIDKLGLLPEMASQILGELRVFRAPTPGEEL